MSQYEIENKEKKYVESILYYITDFSLESLALSSELFDYCFNLKLDEKYFNKLSESNDEKSFIYLELDQQQSFLTKRFEFQIRVLKNTSLKGEQIQSWIERNLSKWNISRSLVFRYIEIFTNF